MKTSPCSHRSLRRRFFVQALICRFLVPAFPCPAGVWHQVALCPVSSVTTAPTVSTAWAASCLISRHSTVSSSHQMYLVLMSYIYLFIYFYYFFSSCCSRNEAPETRAFPSERSRSARERNQNYRDGLKEQVRKISKTTPQSNQTTARGPQMVREPRHCWTVVVIDETWIKAVVK